jgi:hypothetical protein
MTKRIAFGPKPSKPAPEQAEAWVHNREVDGPEPTKRLTLDLPQSLHTRIKATCAMRGTKMVEEIRDLLEQKYGKA